MEGLEVLCKILISIGMHIMACGVLGMVGDNAGTIGIIECFMDADHAIVNYLTPLASYMSSYVQVPEGFAHSLIVPLKYSILRPEDPVVGTVNDTYELFLKLIQTGLYIMLAVAPFLLFFADNVGAMD